MASAGVGGASARDYLRLIEQVQAAVAERCGVHLEREIQLAGEW